MKKSIGIKEFAQRLGLSPSTISQALSGHRPVQESTRQLILEKMKEWNYIPNLNAKRLVTKCSNLIAYVSEEGHPEEDSYQIQVIRHICRELRKNNYDLLLDLRSSDDEMRMSQLAERVHSRGVDGSIYLGHTFTEAELEELSSPMCPCVYADDALHKPQPNVCFLCVDSHDSCQDAFHFLRDKCREKLLLVARHKNDSTWALWHELLEQMQWNSIDEIFTAENELITMQETLKAFAVQTFDSIMVRTAPQVQGVLMALKQLGLQPGKDVDVVVHGDEQQRDDIPRLPVSISAFSYKKLSEVAVQSLLDMLRTQDRNPPVKIIKEHFIPFQP